MIGGLALASSLSATVNMILLYAHLRKRTGPLDEKKILSGFIGEKKELIERLSDTELLARFLLDTLL